MTRWKRAIGEIITREPYFNPGLFGILLFCVISAGGVMVMFYFMGLK